MRNFTWNRFPIKNLLIDSLLPPIVESTYLGELIRTPTRCPGFQGPESQTKTSYRLSLHIIQCETCIHYRVCIDTTNWFCGSLVFLLFCKWPFHWTSLPTLGL